MREMPKTSDCWRPARSSFCSPAGTRRSSAAAWRRMRGPVGHDVAQAVCERLWRELKRGRHRDGSWPFRVIVAQGDRVHLPRLVRAGLGRGRVDRDRRPEPGPERRRRHAPRPRDVRRDAAAGRRRGRRGSGCSTGSSPTRSRSSSARSRTPSTRRARGSRSGCGSGSSRDARSTPCSRSSSRAGRATSRSTWTRCSSAPGPETDELARLIDAFLERAPRREPSPESRAAVAALAARLEQRAAAPVGAGRGAPARARRRRRRSSRRARSPPSAEQLVRSLLPAARGRPARPATASPTGSGRCSSELLGPAARAQALEGFSHTASSASPSRSRSSALASADFVGAGRRGAGASPRRASRRTCGARSTSCSPVTAAD